ncbi:MAG: hypothetical protein U1E66_02295 [Rhodospirillales bacterium]
MRTLARRLRNLWAGRLPLADAFWTYNVFWGLLLNLATTVAGFAVLVTFKGNDLAAAISMVLHNLALPYNVVVLAGVWRSAGRAQISPWLRGTLRAVALILFAAFTIV